MKIVFFGLTISSSWGNGHATTYRSLLKALALRGHSIVFIEKDVEWYRNNRDLSAPDFCTLLLYNDWQASYHQLLHRCFDADAIVVGSYFPDAVSVTKALLDNNSGPLLFYDIDTPITLAQLRTHGRTDYLEASLIPYYSAYLSFTGGPALGELELVFGSPCAAPLYCSVDPSLYCPTRSCNAFCSDLSYLGTYAADRQHKLTRMLCGSADLLQDKSFLVAGPQYPSDISWPSNVRRISHIAPADHPVFYSSSRFTLNLTRNDMVTAGFSPSVRLFEASACGTAIVSDAWRGLENFLVPGEEILIPRDEYELSEILSCLPDSERIRLGRRARERILSEHTSVHRAMEFERIIERVHSLRHSATQAHAGSQAPGTMRHKGRELPLPAVDDYEYR